MDDGALVMSCASHSRDVALALLPLLLLRRWHHRCAGIIAAIALAASLRTSPWHRLGIVAIAALTSSWTSPWRYCHCCCRGAGIITALATAAGAQIMAPWRCCLAPACAPLTAGVERTRAGRYHCAPRPRDGGGWRGQWCFWRCRAPPARVRRTALVARRMAPWCWRFLPPAGGTLMVAVERTIAWHYHFSPAYMTAAWMMALWCC